MLNFNPGVNMSSVHQTVTSENDKNSKSKLQSLIDAISHLISKYITHRKANNLDNPVVRTNIARTIAKGILKGENNGLILTGKDRKFIATSSLNNIDLRNRSTENINATVREALQYTMVPTYKNEILKELKLEASKDKQTEIKSQQSFKIETRMEAPKGMNFLTEFERLKDEIAQGWMVEKEVDPQASYDDFIAGWKARLLDAPL